MTLTAKLEFSVDPLSDTTPAYVDITQYLMEASWSSGKARDLDEPQAGSATFRLKNTGRRFEPEYAAGAYYPNIVPMRRFRWSITADGVSYPQGIWYAQSWQVTYPAGTAYSEVVVSCVDGFGVLSQYPLPNLGVPAAESYVDVVMADNPFAYYTLRDTVGRKMSAETGPEGVYRGAVDLGQPGPVLGDSGTGVRFTQSSLDARAKLDDVNVFADANAFSIEAVVNIDGGGVSTGRLGAGPQNATSYTMELDADRAFAVVGTSTLIATPSVSSGTGRHHFAATFDGATLTHYKDGVVTGTASASQSLATPTAGEYLYPGAGLGVGASTFLEGHVAFYNYPLTPTQIAAHSTAALSRGYDTTTAGTRIATLATHPLWSTAGIPAGQITVQPEMQHGQAALDELLETVKAETPIGLFYFDDSGNPDYQPWDYSTTLQVTFGEQEVQYDGLDLQYDDEVFNQSSVGREDGVLQTSADTSSQAAYSVRSQDETGLIIKYDSDAALIAQTIVDRFATPMYRIAAVSLNGATQNRRLQILQREIGDTIRVTRRGEGGTANPDVVTRILGKSKTLDVHGDLRCTWNLARGFPAATQVWRLGQIGYTELGTGTVLG